MTLNSRDVANLFKVESFGGSNSAELGRVIPHVKRLYVPLPKFCLNI
jgi:uncharacterized protein YqgC (DUF456 family)